MEVREGLQRLLLGDERQEVGVGFSQNSSYREEVSNHRDHLLTNNVLATSEENPRETIGPRGTTLLQPEDSLSDF